MLVPIQTQQVILTASFLFRLMSSHGMTGQVGKKSEKEHSETTKKKYFHKKNDQELILLLHVFSL